MIQEEIARQWLERFPHLSPDRVMGQFLPMLGQAWEAKKTLFKVTHLEDAITNSLIAHIKQQIRNNKNISWGVYPQVSLLEDAEGIGQTIGRCDLIVILGGNREYIYECKRLWAEGKGRTFTKSARLYVRQGVRRFLQPSKEHPTPHAQYDTWQNFAGMIGYVMDGRAPEACIAVQAATQKYAPPQEMTIPCPLHCTAKDVLCFGSTHQDCTNRIVQVHHVLFGLPTK